MLAMHPVVSRCPQPLKLPIFELDYCGIYPKDRFYRNEFVNCLLRYNIIEGEINSPVYISCKYFARKLVCKLTRVSQFNYGPSDFTMHFYLPQHSKTMQPTDIYVCINNYYLVHYQLSRQMFTRKHLCKLYDGFDWNYTHFMNIFNILSVACDFKGPDCFCGDISIMN